MARYKQLSEKSVNADPFQQFDKWYNERLASGIFNPEAFTLASVSLNGDVSARMVLLKEHSPAGFIFFTNFTSRKGQQLSENKIVAMLFYWPESGRQIRIEGKAEKIPSEVSARYFSSRSRESRIGAWASEQSSIIPGKNYLDSRIDELKNKFKGKNIPLPPFWGGFRIIPSWFEFWQEGKHRLHDRLTYSLSDKGWIIKRLAP